MKKIDFNQEWIYKRLGEDGEGTAITLPHDAMCREKRSMESRGIHNIGWFESYDYEYSKKFEIPESYQGKVIIMEFEGVYHHAEVSVNGKKLIYRPYGYTNFFVDLTDHLHYGGENEIQVIARNADQPNSRWYSGSGIYRPVWMYVGEEASVLPDGVRARTVSVAAKGKGEERVLTRAKIAVSVETRKASLVKVEVYDNHGAMVADGCYDNGRAAELELEVPDPKLWSMEHPVLYKVRVMAGEDEQTETFGIRLLKWDSRRGLTMNGKHVILKGACIHHDNGVLGACAFPEAEERKVRLLMEQGYNAIRSAHNPCSKAMLEACDRLGMLVMDEYTDMWYIHKNQYDYAGYMQDWWQEDLRDMVKKDYNHPSVVLYSTGNEVAETSQVKGIKLTGEMTAYLHSLDSTRPVTCGVNIFFNFLYSMGFGVYNDEKAKKEAAQSAADPSKKKKAVGSEFYNTLAGLLGDKTMKYGATLHMCDVKTRDAFANMDIAGYNYGIYRYKKDLKKYPNRLILGSETFCKDAYDFLEFAKKHPRIIGDFVWAGMDYIGEAGIGAWEYEDYAPKDKEECGWLTAGSGRIDILGYTGGEALYTKVALEKEQGPFLAVKPVYQRGKHSPSAWKMTDAMPSWSWPGCEGYQAAVEVYARAAKVELFLNGKSMGKKVLKNTCNTTFTVPYEAGTLEVISYNAEGSQIGRDVLCTAKGPAALRLTPENPAVLPGGLSYVRLEYKDEQGVWMPMEKHDLKVQVENGVLLGFGNACAYNKDGYWKDETNTYYGRALAVVRAGEEGVVTVKVQDEQGEHTLEIPVHQ